MPISRPDDPTHPSSPEALPEPQARDLLERMWRGDVSALDALLGIYWRPLIRYAYSIVHNMDTAEDVVQDIFVNLWHSRRDWPAIRSIRSYLYRSTRNRALNERRDLKVRSDWIASERRVERGTATPADVLDRSELDRAADAAIQALSPKRREVFVLFSRHNLSYHEIGRVMGISYQTVANHMSAALRSLRRSLAEYVEIDG